MAFVCVCKHLCVCVRVCAHVQYVITLVLSVVLVGPGSVHGCLSVQAVQVLSPAVRVEVAEELLHCVEGCYGLVQCRCCQRNISHRWSQD
jgi:hypothetical protein